MEKIISFSGWLTVKLDDEYWVTTCETGEQDYNIISAEVIDKTPSELTSSVSLTNRKATVSLSYSRRVWYSFKLKLTLDTDQYLLAGNAVLDKLAATPDNTCYHSTNTYTTNYPDYAGKYIYTEDGSSKDLLNKLYESAYEAGDDDKPVLRDDQYKNFPWLYPITTSNGKIAGQYKVSDESLYPIAKGYTPGYATFTGEASADGKSAVVAGGSALILNRLITTRFNTSKYFETTIKIKYAVGKNNTEYLLTTVFADDGFKLATCYTLPDKAVPEEVSCDEHLYLNVIPKALGFIAWGRGGDGADGPALYEGNTGGGGGAVGAGILNLATNGDAEIVLGCYKKVNGYWRNTDTIIKQTSSRARYHIASGKHGASASGGSGGVISQVLWGTAGGNGGSKNTSGTSRSSFSHQLFISTDSTKFNLVVNTASGGLAYDKSGGGGGASFGKGGNGASRADKHVATAGVLGGGGGGGYGLNNYSDGGKGGPAGIILFY